MFTFSKQELRSVKRHLKNQLSFMMNLKETTLQVLCFKGDTESNPGPVVTHDKEIIQTTPLAA